MIKLNFAEWLKEMTSCAAVGGGGTSTADIARFARPLFSEPVRRVRKEEKEKKKDKN